MIDNRRLAIVYPQVGLDVVPSLVAMIRALSVQGFMLDIYTCQDGDFPVPEFAESNIRLFFLSEHHHKGQSGWRWQFFQQWLPYIVKQSRQNKYHCLLGIDPWGLILAGIAGKMVRIPFSYFSLEVFCWKTLRSPYLKILKLLEQAFNRSATFTIIQDWERAALLMRENRIHNKQIEILPNAPSGEAIGIRTDYLRRKLDISPERPILLHLANSYPVQMGVDLARAAQRWDANWAIVFHTRSINSYAKELRSLVDNRTVYFSGKPVSSGELISIIASADIGIALYSICAEENLYYLGRSSGKIAHYLQAGLPVIAPDLPSVRAYIEKYECGVCVNEVDDVRDAVLKVMGNYQYYSNNAITCFREQFNFEKHFWPILQRFLSLT
jgi:glycosyltransferase involved in cell wall biosynthesis